MGRLDHPRIVPVLSVSRDEETGLRGLCMPFREGRALHEVLERMESTPLIERTARTLWSALASDGSLTAAPPGSAWQGFPLAGSYADAVAWVGAALADGLTHAHALGIQHRDIKPANILMTLDGGPQLLDFNLAHDPLDPRQADAARRGGTLPYMAPEQISAFLDSSRWHEVGRAADFFALGLVLRELLTGRRPEAPSADLPLPRALQDQLDRRREPADGPRTMNPTVPLSMEVIVRRCLSPNPADRYTEATALGKDLRRHLKGLHPTEAGRTKWRDRVVSFVERHRIGLVAGGLLVVGGALAGPTISRESGLFFILREARTSLDAGSLETAEQGFQRVVLLDPANAGAREGLKLVYVERANRALADVEKTTSDIQEGLALGKEFDQWITSAREMGYRPTVADAPKLARAASYLASGDPTDRARARSLAQEALALDPSSWRGYHALGKLAGDDKDHGRARDCFEQAYKCAQTYPPVTPKQVEAELLNSWAGASIALGDLNDARVQVQKVQSHKDDSGYRNRPDYKAIQSRARALESRIALQLAKQAMASLDSEEAMNQTNSAAELAEAALSLLPDDPLAKDVLKQVETIWKHVPEFESRIENAGGGQR
jgi:tetratricopeptide (TPR) repeat protein